MLFTSYAILGCQVHGMGGDCRWARSQAVLKDRQSLLGIVVGVKLYFEIGKFSAGAREETQGRPQQAMQKGSRSVIAENVHATLFMRGTRSCQDAFSDNGL